MDLCYEAEVGGSSPAPATFIKENKMTDETKEILIGVVDYYNAMGTEKDPGIERLQDLVQRASKVLMCNAQKSSGEKSSADVDPFAITAEFPTYKLEDEW